MKTNPLSSGAKFFVAACAFLLLLIAVCAHSTVAQTNTFPASGNAGIGTTTPASPLVVSGNEPSVDYATVRVKPTVTHGGIVIDSANNSSQVHLRFYKSGVPKWQFRVPFQEGTEHLRLYSWTASADVMSISPDGNVGIGSTAPAHRLDVQGDAQWIARFKKTNSAHGGILVDAASGYNPNVAMSVNGIVKWYMNSNTSSGDALQFWESSGNNPRFTLTQAGNVGIGITSPLYSLDVNGGINGFRAKANTVSSSDIIAAFENTSGIQAVVRGNGFFGIGTTSPLYSLDVNGGTNGFRAKANTVSISDAIATFENASGVQAVVRGNGFIGIGLSNPSEKLEVTGNFKVSGSITGGTIQAKYQDVAEWVESSQTLAAGTVVVLDHTRSNQVIASSKAYDTRVAGVISLQPGIALGESGAGKVLVATTGRVKIKVDASAGPIQIGDLLVTSDVVGVAKKSEALNLGGVAIHRPGTLIGKALEPLAKGAGEILVLLSLQ